MSRPGDQPIVFEDSPDEPYIRHPFPLRRWWNELAAVEQGLYGGLGLMAVGIGAVGAWPVALIVTGAVLAGIAAYTVVATVRRSLR